MNINDLWTAACSGDLKALKNHYDNGSSKEALELASEIHGESLEERGYLYNETTGEYEYQEEE